MKKLIKVITFVAVFAVFAVLGAALANGKLGALLRHAAATITGKLGSGSDDSARYGKPDSLPELGQAKEIAPGILMHVARIGNNVEQRRLFVYMPKNRENKLKKLPAVFIAPAGTASFFGSALDGGEEEHLPYVKAGYVVVAYELSGPVSEQDKKDDAKLLAAAKAYKRSEAGILNARDAIDYALAKIPAIDPERIYVAGHSSAGAVALAVAEHDPRVKACIAYAPVTNTLQRLEKKFEVMPFLEDNINGYRDFILHTSPLQNVSRLQVPTFLFHADDDSVVTRDDLAPFVEAAGKSNKRVTLVTVGSGDHYDSMIREGIPNAIKWLNSL